MPNIYDNLNPATTLGPALQTSLEHFKTVDAATGYLDLRGWDSFADVVEAKAFEEGSPPVARVLVGMVAPADSQQLLESLKEQVQPPAYGANILDMDRARDRRDQLVKHLRNQLMRGLATTKGQKTLQTLKGQLQTGRVQMKVFTQRPLHGKTYIFHAPDDPFASKWGYVGSSNLTGAGLHNNLELNIDVQDSDATAKLATWFDEQWEDPFSLPITEEIIELIANSWAEQDQPTPFEVYLKVCHALSQDARDGMGYVLPRSMSTLLLDYQENAVRTLSRRIVRRGGTMLGDVVGLGKTLTAVATALMLQAAEDYSTLVLCPKNLEKMWNEHLEKYDITGRVVPYSMAEKVLPELKRFNLVICDESHNLRNNSTVAYEAIHDYIRANSSKVLLLTATPYNLAFTDVANQLALYIDEDDDLGFTPSAALAKDPNLRSKVDGKIDTLAAFRLSEEPEDWRRLMSDHLIRRTRSFIKRTARTETVSGPDGSPVEREYLQFANGTKFHFPTRVATPISHAFGTDDPARLMEDEATLDAVRDLQLPRYRLADYEDPKARKTDEDRTILEDIRSGRGNVSGFVRIGLFKRLSSSGHSFVLSLQRQRARNELFIYAIEAGKPIPIGSLSNRQVMVSDEDVEANADAGGSLATRYDAMVDSAPAKTRWINSGVFKPTLLAELEQDNAAINDMLARFGNWDASRDSKINALIDLLAHDHKGQKVLVFTEYSDTASYVASALTVAGINNVGLATGDSENPSDLARRFSPESNLLPGEDATTPVTVEDPIDVLVATDVLSEGQNLQDSHIVVNYDLPWAIIRIIQRAGRVDRIGQKSDVVNVYLITHEKIEEQINLRKRIKHRLGAAAQAFGSDERFFGGDEEVRILDDLYKGRVGDDEEAEADVDAVSEAWLVWSQAQDKHPDITQKVLTMQDMVHTTRDQRLNEPGGSVSCFVSTESGVDAFATASITPEGHGSTKLLTPLEAMAVFRAEPTTPTATIREDHFEWEAKLVHGPLHIESLAAGNLKGIRKWTWQRLGGTVFGNAAGPGLDALHERPLTAHATVRLTQARRNKYSLDDLAALIAQLHGEDRLVIGTRDSDTIKIVCSLGVQNA